MRWTIMNILSSRDEKRLSNLLHDDFLDAINQKVIIDNGKKVINIQDVKKLEGKYFTFELEGKISMNSGIYTYWISEISKEIKIKSSPAMIKFFNELQKYHLINEVELYIKAWFDIDEYNEEIVDWLFEGQYLFFQSGEQKQL